MHKNLRKIGQVVLEICLQTNRRTLCIPTEGRVTRTTTGGTSAVPAGSGVMPRLTPDATGSGGSKRVLRPDSSTRPNSCLARLRSCRSVWILHTHTRNTGHTQWMPTWQTALLSQVLSQSVLYWFLANLNLSAMCSYCWYMIVHALSIICQWCLADLVCSLLLAGLLSRPIMKQFITHLCRAKLTTCFDDRHMLWWNFLRPEIRTKYQREASSFLDTWTSLKHCIQCVERSHDDKNQLDLSRRFDKTWNCDKTALQMYCQINVSTNDKVLKKLS